MVNQLCLHINNGGVVFAAGVNDSGDLAIVVEATHFGNITNNMHINTDAESLRKIGEMFIEASKQPHEVYPFAARVLEQAEMCTDGTV